MRILLTNDDGCQAPGLRALYDALEGLAELWVAAPVEERSGVSHGFTIRDPLRVDLIPWTPERRGFAVQGTPVDAVKLGVRSLLPAAPDLLVAGINQGENTGVDLLYSGTVAAAIESAILDVPAVAVSLASRKSRDFAAAAAVARLVVETALEKHLAPGKMLNVNVPAIPLAEIKGIRLTRQAASRYIENVRRIDDASGGDCYWAEYYKVLTEQGQGSDVEAIREGYVSITPLQARFTELEMIPLLYEWGFSLDGL